MISFCVGFGFGALAVVTLTYGTPEQKYSIVRGIVKALTTFAKNYCSSAATVAGVGIIALPDTWPQFLLSWQTTAIPLAWSFLKFGLNLAKQKGLLWYPKVLAADKTPLSTTGT